MTTKHWKLSLFKDGRRITLFITTTELLIEVDLARNTSQSLIHTARQFHRRAQTPAQDHCDLAVGALMVHAGAPPYDLTFEHIESIPMPPEGAPTHYVGGDSSRWRIPVWELDSSADADDEPAEPEAH